MKDYTNIIQQIMGSYSGIANDSQVPEVLRKIESSSIPGAKQLVKNFLSSNEQSSHDYWLEIFIMWKLMNDKRISNLSYESKKKGNKPDFRFNIDTICYDLEVKYIRPHVYEKEKSFIAECENCLSNVQKPWFFSYQLRHNFQKYHISEFISYLKAHINNFQTNIQYY